MINTKKENLKITIYAVIAIVVVLMLFCGCAPRKTSKSETTEKVKSEVTDNSKTTTDTNSNIKVTNKVETNTETGEVTEVETLEPIDNSKPAIHTDENGKAETLNNTKKTKTKTRRKTTENKKVNTIVDKSMNVAKIEQNNIKTTIKAKKSVSNKQTERKQFNILSLWWLIPLILLIYFGYKKRKELFL